jgi:hypothetical protein
VDGRPGRRDQGGLQPGPALAHARGAVLSRTLVIAGTESGPRD